MNTFLDKKDVLVDPVSGKYYNETLNLEYLCYTPFYGLTYPNSFSEEGIPLSRLDKFSLAYKAFKALEKVFGKLSLNEKRADHLIKCFDEYCNNCFKKFNK